VRPTSRTSILEIVDPVFAVITTGIYCRPSCPAKRPRPENVRHFASAQTAEEAGFRACKRCLPDQPERHSPVIAACCRHIEATGEHRLATLSTMANLSPFHFQRVFKAATGVTPKQYATAHRSARTGEALARNTTITDAIYDAGYNSSGRFYESSQLGMTPARYQARGKGLTITYSIAACSLGVALAARTERGICAILLGDDPATLIADLHQRFSNATLRAADDPHFDAVLASIESPALGLALPLDIQGTAFQQRVWRALQGIPAGTTIDYSRLARSVGSPKGARAVAAACAANPIAVAVPCHRVIRNNGDLAGYRWGLDRKRELLNRERKP
jgi:AraC family transcriptional regulator of adaptative response/methylated-DNA-[protein]-cysteine methyltransferase